MEQIKLTQFSPGAGCGCKISPADLEEILKSELKTTSFPNLLVGNESKDDAAVYDLGNGTSVVSTTDFFTPIVDDPFNFGKIAATNALSDIYAMGGKPIMALAILGWPLDKLGKDVAQQVIEGARTVCSEAKIALAGGHSIDIADPIFGLAVTGIVDTAKVKQNNQATDNCTLYITKPIGVGIVTTAEKNKIVEPNHIKQATDLMITLNTPGTKLSELDYVKTMTDVTGFGMLGHLLEICESSNVAAEIEFEKVPLIDGVAKYAEQKSFPGGTFRNWKSYGHKIGKITDNQKHILCDPQTSGGLLVVVNTENENEFTSFCQQNNIPIHKFGNTIPYNNSGKYISVK